MTGENPRKQRRFRLGALALAAVLATARPAPAQEPEPPSTPAPEPTPTPEPWYKVIAFDAFLSISYSYNTNRPVSRTNQFRVFDFNDNTFNVDVAEVVFQKAVARPGEAGFRIDLEAGSTIPQVSAAFGLFRDESGDAVYFDLQQAFVSYIAPIGSGLRLDFGKFVTNHGYEVIEGYDGYNHNATHSYLFGFGIPFTHAGFKAGYTFSDQLAAMVMLVNGWDVVRDNNSGKSGGAQLIFTPSKKITVAGNYMVGPERTDTNGDLRQVFDVNTQWNITDRIALAIDAVYGTEPNAVVPGQTATWSGFVGYALFTLSDRFALNLRGELFDDPDGARTGVAQTLNEVTLTPEFNISSHFVVRADLRIDWSDRDVFETDDGFTDNQPTFLLNVIYVF